MTKKDYMLLGDVVREFISTHGRDHDEEIDTLLRLLSSALKRDNPRFNQQQFEGYIFGNA